MSDHLERLEAAYATRRAKVAGTRPDVVEVLSADLRAALDELKQLREDVEEVAGDRNGHRDRQIWAERALAVLLAREGGATELTPAELTRANLDGSFVSSRDVATGNERIEFRASRRRRAAPQQPEPEPCDGDCDCDCQPGQPCLCPERDCYCGPCRVCGENPQQPEPERSGT